MKSFLVTASKHVITKHQTGNNNQDGKKAVAHKKHDTHTNANPEQNKTNQPFHTAPSQKKELLSVYAENRKSFMLGSV